MLCRTIVLYCVLHYATKDGYFYTYWSLIVLDTMLQLCVVYEVASRVFRPLDVWADDVRSSFIWLLGLSLSVALGLTWLASPPARTWMQAFATKGNLFAAALLSELFVAMMALSINAGLPWKTHVAKIAQGLGAYSLISVLIEPDTVTSASVESYRLYYVVSCSHGCVPGLRYLLDRSIYGREERPGLSMTNEMREEMFTLQTRLEYHLRDLRFTEQVNTPNLYFVAAIGIFLSVLISIAGYFYFRGRRSSAASWEDLFAKLAWIDRNNIAAGRPGSGRRVRPA